MLNQFTKHDNGFTLVEMMLSMAIGLIIMSIVFQALSQQLASQSQALLQRRLSAEVDTVMQLISRQLRRSGAQSLAPQQVVQRYLMVSPFAAALQISAHPREVTNSCVLFAYDKNRNGRLDTHQPNEYAGFRLFAASIEMRQRQADCGSGGWQDLTDPDVTVIEHLSFQRRAPSAVGAARQVIQVSIHARSRRHPQLTEKRQRLILVDNYAS